MTVCGEKVTGVCVAGKCPYFKRCHPVVWDKYGKIKPKTNEEWFCSLPTKEKARFIADNDGTIQIGDEVDYQNTMTKWLEWLKEKHDG